MTRDQIDTAITQVAALRDASRAACEAVLQLDYRGHRSDEAAGPTVMARLHVRQISDTADELAARLDHIGKLTGM